MMTLYNKTQDLKKHLELSVFGQPILIERLLLALLANGHLLVEGAPGLAKTRSIKMLSDFIEADFHRIQFTPDLMPADITGTEIYEQNKAEFNFQKGPVFHNLILADEINRASAKVQSALLEAMAEGQVTVGKKTYILPELFLVMATQNPLEQEGTFNLPEAQLDRFMMHVKIDYPSFATEKQIVHLSRQEQMKKPSSKNILLSQNDIFAIRKEIINIHMDQALEDYMIQIVIATRTPQKYHEDLSQLIEYGASPRASIYLDRCSRALAWLNNRDFVIPSDIQNVVYDILRHRIGLSFYAESKGLKADSIIDRILTLVTQP